MKDRILIIDDDEDLCEGLSFILREDGYHVMSASTAVRGTELIDKHLFHIALLDYKMPRMTGVDLLKRIKAKNPETKVFIVSGKPFMRDLLKKEKISHLVEGVITKPFTENELLAAIRGDIPAEE